MISRLRQLRSHHPERGSLTPGAVVLATALLLVIGLVVDSGRHLNALDQAGDVAAQAAHAAGQQLDTDRYGAGNGIGVNTSNAVAAAQNVLTSAGATGTVSADGDRIQISTSISKPTAFLSLIGVTTVTGTGQAEVRLAIGG